jgi:hypothetical protein
MYLIALVDVTGGSDCLHPEGEPSTGAELVERGRRILDSRERPVDALTADSVVAMAVSRRSRACRGRTVS